MQNNVSTPLEAKEWLWNRGYLWAPGVRETDVALWKKLDGGRGGPMDQQGKPYPVPNDFLDLDLDGKFGRKIVELSQSGPMALEYRDAGIIAHSRAPVVDGQLGDATYRMMSVERCGCPDYGVPLADITDETQARAIGEGPWKGCHGVGQFHAAHFQYQNEPPSHMLRDAGDGETVFTKVLRKAREEDAKIGLLCYYSGPGVDKEFHPPDMNSVQSRVSWVVGDGWIGLAIVGNDGMTCAQMIWIRYDNRWGANYGITQLIRGHALLELHEKGHNKGLGHTQGGIMNPSLRIETNPSWIGDVAEAWMKRKFGGVAVPIPGDPEPPDDDDPDDPNPPGDDCECTWSSFVSCGVTLLFRGIFKNPLVRKSAIEEMRKAGVK